MNGQQSRTWIWVLVGAGAFLVMLVGFFLLMYFSFRAERGYGFGEKIAVVDLQGIILTPEEVVDQLRRYGDDDSIKAIIVHINTPGGGAAASEEIYRMVKRVREEKKKRVVASIETVGASGGYYVASATEKIYADNASIVGSIGVIAQWYNYGDLLRWAKLKDVTFKSGEFKDTGSPTRELTPAEKQYLQSLIDDMHGQFVAAVAQGRSMKVEDVRAIADGKVWTGQQALGMKLVDQVGDFRTAVLETAKAVGIEGEPQLVRARKERHTLLDLLLGDVDALAPSKAQLMENQVGFYYLWK